MYGLPKETEDQWLTDIENAIQFQPDHLSCYMLTLEPGTPLYQKHQQKKIKPLSQENITNLFKNTSIVLSKKGYDHYEISNFSRSLKTRSQHNSNYWRMKSYNGFGPAAHSFDGDKRFWNISNLEAYIKSVQSNNSPVEEKEVLTTEQKKMEMIMLGLRTSEGVNIQAYNDCFDRSFEKQFKPVLRHIINESLGYLTDQYFALNLEGKVRLNNIVESFATRIFNRDWI